MNDDLSKVDMKIWLISIITIIAILVTTINCLAEDIIYEKDEYIYILLAILQLKKFKN